MLERHGFYLPKNPSVKTVTDTNILQENCWILLGIDNGSVMRRNRSCWSSHWVFVRKCRKWWPLRLTAWFYLSGYLAGFWQCLFDLSARRIPQRWISTSTSQSLKIQNLPIEWWPTFLTTSRHPSSCTCQSVLKFLSEFVVMMQKWQTTHTNTRT